MTDVEQILMEMQKGFGSVHSRINDLAQEAHERQLGCFKRFGAIDQAMAVKEAKNGITEDAKKKKVDSQTWLVRTGLGVIITGVLILIGKMFLGHIDVIIK